MDLFSGVDVGKATIEELVECLTPAFKGLAIEAPIIKAGTKFFRARIVADRPGGLDAVGVPPANAIIRPGRLNRTGQRIGYYSTSRRSAYFEVGVAAGDNIVLSRWVAETDLVLLHVGYQSNVFSSLSSERSGSEYGWVRETRDRGQRHREIYDALSDELSKSVEPGEEWKYRTTIAIADKFLGDGPHDGLLYPALAMSANADNLALKETALGKLRPYAVEFNKVTEVDGSRLNVDLIDSTTRWDRAGILQWNGRRLCWRLPPQSAATAKAEDGEWVLYDPDGNEIFPE